MTVSLQQFGNPPSEYRANAEFTISILSEIFAAFPGRFRFTSGWRSASRNAAVNGVPNSYHLTGEAGDFVPVDGKYPANEREAINNIVSRYGYKVITHDAGSGMHYHIEPISRTSKKMPSGLDFTNTMFVAAAGLFLILLVTE